MDEDTVDIDDDAIRAKAYELWQLRGCPSGSPGEDWERAARLLREEAVERRTRQLARAGELEGAADRDDLAAEDEGGSGVDSAPSSDDEVTLPTGVPLAASPQKALPRKGSRGGRSRHR